MFHAGHRLRRLVVASSAARIGTCAASMARAEQVRAGGMYPVAAGAAPRWFTPGFHERAPTTVARLVDALRDCDPDGYAACCLALAEADLRADSGQFSNLRMACACPGIMPTCCRNTRMK